MADWRTACMGNNSNNTHTRARTRIHTAHDVGSDRRNAVGDRKVVRVCEFVCVLYGNTQGKEMTRRQLLLLLVMTLRIGGVLRKKLFQMAVVRGGSRGWW